MSISNYMSSSGGQPRNEDPRIPPGRYTAKIESAYLNNLKDQTGKFVKVSFCLLDGDSRGARIDKILMVERQVTDERSQTSVEMGRRALSFLVEAAGVDPSADFVALTGKIVQIEIDAFTDRNGNDRTGVGKVYRRESPQQTPPPPAPAPPASMGEYADPDTGEIPF